MLHSILIIQTGFLGDAALATGMIRGLRESVPSVRIGYMVRSEFAGLFRDHPGIDRLHGYDKRAEGGTAAVLEEVRHETYGAAAVPHRSARSALIPFRARIPLSVGFRQSDFSLLFTRRVPYDISLAEIDRNAALLAELGIATRPEERRGWLAPTEEAVESVLRRYPDEDRRIVLAPGSVWETKRWPAEKFAELASELHGTGYTVYLVGSAAEEELCSRIATMTTLPSGRVLAGRLSLPELAAFLSRSERVVTNDSASLHIAEAVGTPVTAVFGPTVPEFGFAPYLPSSRVVERRGLACRPCGIHGHRSCPIGTHECMHEIPVDAVLGTVTGFAGSESSPQTS